MISISLNYPGNESIDLIEDGVKVVQTLPLCLHHRRYTSIEKDQKLHGLFKTLSRYVRTYNQDHRKLIMFV